jgi:superfamily II DNA or RNA helicase
MLRDYQNHGADLIEEAWNVHGSTMVVMPTGTGKTVLFAEIIRRRSGKRTIVVAHREELIFQAKDKIEKWAGLDCEIEMGDLIASANLFTCMPVVIATVQTLVSGRGKKRMERFNPMDFDTLIIDEFHHAPADSYRAVIDYFKKNPNLKILGVTATPDRTDEEALGQVCESVAFNYEIVDAISDGWLVPIEQQMVTIAGLDFSAVRTTAGDLNGADLAAIMEAEQNLHGLCAATLEIIGARQTIVFTASVKHAEMACNIFNRHKDGIAAWICGKTEKDHRRKLMKSVVDGHTQILCNVGVATEGFDAPGVEVIVMGRPTKSRALYAQMAGRATRPWPGIVDGLAGPEARREAIAASRKPSALLVDFVGNSGRHKLVTGTDLLGGKFSDDVKAKAKELMEGGERKNIRQALEDAQEELIRLAEEAKRREEAKKARLIAKAKYSVQGIDPFNVFDIEKTRNFDDRAHGTLSDKQRAMLAKIGVNPDQIPFAHAKQLIAEQYRRWDNGLCTLKQAKTLKRYGYETKNMKMTEASHLLDALARNSWKPTGLPQSQPAVAVEMAEEAF